MSKKTIPTDAEIKEAFEGYDFGGSDPVAVLHDGLLKSACGYQCGSALDSILVELGLIHRKNQVTLTRIGMEACYKWHTKDEK